LLKKNEEEKERYKESYDTEGKMKQKKYINVLLKKKFISNLLWFCYL